MNLPSITALAKSYVRFERYQDGALWYSIKYTEWSDDPVFGSAQRIGKAITFEFPIPVDDTGGGVFLPEDKGLTFMRWIRKHLEYLKSSLDEEGAS